MDSAGPLTTEKFGTWLRLGRGLAVLRAGEASGAAYQETLFDACTHFTAHDFQVEGSRAEYLFDVLVAAGVRDTLEPRLLAALQSREGHDLEQLLELAYLFALDGSIAAELAIRDTFLRCVQEQEHPGAEQAVRALGLPGLALVAREMGRVLPESGVDWYEAHPLEVAEAQFGEEAVSEALTRSASTDSLVRKYAEAMRAYRSSVARFPVTAQGDPPPSSTPLPFALTYESLRAAVLETHSPPRPTVLRRWGRAAPLPELQRAADALNVSTPLSLRMAILEALGDRPPPSSADALLEAAGSADERAVSAAWRALRHLDTVEVRSRALEELRKPHPNLEALSGLQQNLRSEDVPVVARALAATEDPDQLHSAGLILLDALEAKAARHLAPLLLSLYERGNCGPCRNWFVIELLKLGAAPRALVQECRYDAYLELRAGAAGWLAKHPAEE